MSHLRLVQPDDAAAPADGPRVSLRLLMAASGRCSCDDCLLAYRAGNRSAGIIDVAAILDRARRAAPLHAVR